MARPLIGVALGSLLVSATAWSQPQEPVPLQVPLGQIQAYCDDFGQAMASCLAQKGAAAAPARPLADEIVRAIRQCREEEQGEFDLYTASFCPTADTGMPASDYIAMCVRLNEQILPCLRKLGYQAVVGQEIRPQDYAYLRHCREQAGADMSIVKYCGPPAYPHAP
jgi:hypothetical protein